jgi:DNA modification methylase
MTAETFLNGKVTLYCGDSREVMKTLADNSVDALVGDPPYALVSIVKRFANSPRSERTENTENPYGRTGRGFMGQRWDTGETAFSTDFWTECLRVLKPGGHLVMSSGTRTYHRLACAVEDAGFEIRDMLSWLYGSGFPKSHDVSKGLGRMLAAPALREQWEGWGTALKPACEPCVFARKPLSEPTVAANVLRWRTGALNIDASRVEATDNTTKAWRGAGDRDRDQYRTGTSGASVPTDIGRWPANVVHDGSPEVLAAFPDTLPSTIGKPRGAAAGDGWGMTATGSEYEDSGSAARFFYTAKADSDDRVGSKHPTVKPIDLMQYFCRLVTPKGGTVLDPFAGTGTTGEAAFREGFNAILIEREAEYQADIRRRMALVMAGPEERKRESIKAKVGDLPFEAGSLFATIQPEAAE